MREDDIERLVRLRWIPAEVITRAPDEEIEPKPDPGERVVFGAHFDRGLGLPASNFFREFLDYFGMQPHHLPANACVLLSCYVAFMGLFDRQGLEDGDLAQKVWTPDHADPADQAGDQAGDDELPQAPDQGGQGEHNPPPSPEQPEEEEPATSTAGPIPAVLLRMRPSCASGYSSCWEEGHGLPSSLPRAAALVCSRRVAPPRGRREPTTVAFGARPTPPSLSALVPRRLPCGASSSASLLQRPSAPGVSRCAGQLWMTCFHAAPASWIQRLEPAGVCRLRPEPEPAELRRLRLGSAVPHPAWWCWRKAREAPRALETAGAPTGRSSRPSRLIFGAGCWEERVVQSCEDEPGAHGGARRGAG
ncbi:hypothetical protein QYE76_005429 [Lolium multiflorum]|uniref:Transposase (putative) gypsy type domain-containing protein n=1 Tax=Lolium multiflorum TaxID=4521 RepID=A0AAD8W287_LOLMU|nr:hypothetical protein QYE76_005429 [Lolium multiflorum]